MSLQDILNRRGDIFRQRLEEKRWGTRKPTVVDLSDEQREALRQGGP